VLTWKEKTKAIQMNLALSVPRIAAMNPTSLSIMIPRRSGVDFVVINDILQYMQVGDG
jgi:hypothetical protein